MKRTITPQQTEHAKLLERIAEALDLTPQQYAIAINRYNSVGNHLKSPSGSLASHSPSVYTQGSFRIGTPIRPLNDEDVFDIDLVCELLMDKVTCTQMQVKTKVGDRLSFHSDFDPAKEPERSRCYRLEYYENGWKFHMDVVPAVPDTVTRKFLLEEVKLSAAVANGAVSITDSSSPDYRKLNGEWPTGNPKGYADWFRSCMQQRFDEIRKAIMLTESFASLEAVPEHRVKTPLQRAVQLLKRHRDNMFGDDKERPSSIIITTLAAHGYLATQEGNLYHALFDILDAMPAFIQQRPDGYWVPNPAYPKENLAESWNGDNGARRRKFDQWRERAMQDLRDAFVEPGLVAIAGVLSRAFGDGSVKRALRDFGGALRQQQAEKRLPYERGTAMIGTSIGQERVPQHSFHQENDGQ
ncbi:MAG: nucleotidyltransferase [Flavobacteriales bacterium]|nr:nucleotidyltransferase [Flavobacteriales bacterium]